ncbi:MAG: non-reducing end alpha-L-arabinofuranosidase family hydrolase [Promethearchaeota archaeon]
MDKIIKGVFIGSILILMVILAFFIFTYYNIITHSSGTKWYVTQPILSPDKNYKQASTSVKDPSIVFYNGFWHVFFTGIGYNPEGIPERTINYASCKRLMELNKSEKFQIKVFSENTTRTAAPQIFLFIPQNKWYLIAQADYGSKYTPVYSTSNNISDPNSWSPVKPLVNKFEPDKWIDFWIIADDQYVYLFYTRNHREMYNLITTIEDFPNNFSDPQKCNGDINVHEASMIYKIKGEQKYIMLTETRYQINRREYYIAESDSLRGIWKNSKLFATGGDLIFNDNVGKWTNFVSHGEVIRSGYNEKLEIESMDKIEFLIQGSLRVNYIKYDDIPWNLGIIRNFINESEGIIYQNEYSAD